MSDKDLVRDFFGDEDYEFLVATATENEDGWAHRCGIAEIAAEMATRVLEGDTAAFECVIEREDTSSPNLFEVDDFRRLALLGLAFGVERQDAACANYLGALYHMGDVVPRDYRRAMELYELADSKGLVRGMINLGYIYEYGRVGEPDYPKAYMQYAKAAAIAGRYEPSTSWATCTCEAGPWHAIPVRHSQSGTAVFRPRKGRRSRRSLRFASRSSYRIQVTPSWICRTIPWVRLGSTSLRSVACESPSPKEMSTTRGTLTRPSKGRSACETCCSV